MKIKNSFWVVIGIIFCFEIGLVAAAYDSTKAAHETLYTNQIEPMTAGNVKVLSNLDINGALLVNGQPFTGSYWSLIGNNIYYNQGWVGIGTSGHKTRLDVRGNLNLQDGNNAGVIYFPRTGIYPALFIRSDDDPTTYEFSSERMMIRGDGRVGIGTTSPNNILHVNGSATVESSLNVNGDITSAGKKVCLEDGTNCGAESGKWDGAKPGNIYYNDGNVGIGTATPTTKLDVAGNIVASGTICDVNGCIGGEVGLTGKTFIPFRKLLVNQNYPSAPIPGGSGVIDLAAATGQPIPDGATHVMLRVWHNMNCPSGSNCGYQMYVDEYPKSGNMNDLINEDYYVGTIDAGSTAGTTSTEAQVGNALVAKIGPGTNNIGWLFRKMNDDASQYSMNIWIEGYFINESGSGGGGTGGGGGMRIESGSVQDDYNNPAWTLDEGTGSRFFTIPVIFSQPFDNIPKVIIGFNTFDVSNTVTGTRASVRAIDITPTGFNARFSTWSNSIVYFLAADWMAYDPTSTGEGGGMEYVGSCMTSEAISTDVNVYEECSCGLGEDIMLLTHKRTYDVTDATGRGAGISSCTVFGQGTTSVYGQARADAFVGGEIRTTCEFGCFKHEGVASLPTCADGQTLVSYGGVWECG